MGDGQPLDHMIIYELYLSPTFPPYLIPSCQTIYVHMTDHEGFNSTWMRDYDALQTEWADLTHDAIALSAADNGVYDHEFWIIFPNHSNASDALPLEYDMCT